MSIYPFILWKPSNVPSSPSCDVVAGSSNHERFSTRKRSCLLTVLLSVRLRQNKKATMRHAPEVPARSIAHFILVSFIKATKYTAVKEQTEKVYGALLCYMQVHFSSEEVWEFDTQCMQVSTLYPKQCLHNSTSYLTQCWRRGTLQAIFRRVWDNHN